MSKYNGFSEEEKTKFINQGGTKISSKLIFTSESADNDITLFDAVNIDWNGYKMGDEEFSYTGDVLSYIKTQLDSKATTSSFDDFTDSFTRNSQVILYNTTDSKKTYPTKIEDSITWNDNIFVNSIGDPDITYGWRYNIKDTESNPYVWMASMTYTETFSNNAWEIGNFHDMSSYILLSGESGVNGNFKSTVFIRTNDTPLAPKTGAVYDTGLPTNRSVYVQLIPREISIMGIQWSDGIPSGKEILWASTAIISAENPAAAQWTTPRQMTDTETYDVEFSPLESEYGNPTNNPNNWYDPQDTLPEGTTWEDMIWRAERTCINGDWTAWIIVKIKGDRGDAGKPADYYEQRWCITETSDQISAPANDGETAPIIGKPHDTWKLTPQYESGKITWLTSRKVIYYGNPGEYEAIYDGEWSTPMRMTGTDGVSNPIQPVLKYYWHTDYSTAPSYNASEQNPNVTNVNGETVWAESPGNPHDSYIYLWMIQGQRHEGHMIDLDSSDSVSYWTSPVCLSGKNGEPGEDTPSIEFIYKRFINVHEFTNDNPASWYTSSSINKPTEEWTGSGNNNSFAYVNSYLGPVEQGWTDHPQGITNTYKYEYATYRKTRDINGESYWDVFNTPFAWSVYGENGLDGDGVEYIYTTTENNAKPSQTYIPTATEFNASQIQSEWGVGQSNGNSSENGDTTWHDDPQQVNNAYQKYQWVSTRKYKTITDDNYTYLLSSNPKMLSQWFVSYDLIDAEKILWATKITGRPPQNIETTKEPLNDKNGQQLKIGDKAWFPYSTPELWNWYVNNGTDADRIVMLYMRNSSINNSPDAPTNNSNNQYTIAKYSYLGWAESPGNKTDYSENDKTSYAYLWMTSNYYSEKTISENDTIYTLSDEWSTPICLTGETGQEGEDAPGIEFIYFRTGEDNDAPSVPQTDSNYQQNDWPFVGTSYYIIDGVKTLLNQDHDTWSDNPFGVSSTYDYEYAAVRRKPAGNDSQWGPFSKPFLWSKYGEDGVDGDGIEYIFYRSSDENEVTFNPTNNNLPPVFNLNTSENDAFQKPEVKGNGWEDDPQGISEEYRWEYVSVRKFREITESNLTYIPESYRNQVSIGDKIWFPYSDPKVWAHFAVDALATNLVLESDNDMMAVSINENDVVTASVASQATFRLDHNTRNVDTSYYSMYINNSNIQNEVIGFDSEYSYSYLKVNVNNDLKTFAKLQLVNNSAYVLSTTIPEGFDMTEIENELRITSYAVITDNSFDNTGNIEIDTQRIFTNKVNGLHLSIDDIYQIQLDRNVIKTDPNGELETVTAYLKSMTSNSLITNTQDAVAQHLYLFYNNCLLTSSGNQGRSTYGSYTVPIGQELALRNDPSIIEHEFSLYYDSDDVYRNNIGGNNTQQDETSSQRQILHGSLLDHEVISRVFDGEKGNPGTDSKSQEYIYFVTDDLSYFDDASHNSSNPSLWNVNEAVNINDTTYYAYNTDDFPFVNGQTSYMGWEDTQIGISEALPYQFTSIRTFNTSTEKWEAFSQPVCIHNWGHSGEDGDGVEYIYYLTNEENKVFNETNNPQYWTHDTYYQSSEYIRENTEWSDNPSGVSDDNKYEYVSVRKYKNTIIQNLAESTQNNSNEFNINYTNYTAQWNPENMIPYKKFMSIEDIMNYTYEDTVQYVYLGSGIGANSDYQGRIDIRYAMAQCIHLLWTTKLTGLKNAYEMLYLLMAFYTAKQSTSTLTLDSFKYEAIKQHYNNTNNNDPDKMPSDRYKDIINILMSGANDPNYQETYNLLSNIWDNFNDAGFKISDFSRNIGLQIVIDRIKFNSTFIKKQWTPYSAPALWSSYGTPGAPGTPGGSGLTIDFDNPSMQIAVNSTGYIKDNQTVTTYLNLYEGTQHINNQYVTLSIDNGPDAFTYSYVSSDKFGYTLHNSGNYTYYTWTIGDIDIDNDGTIGSNESQDYSNILKLEDNAQLSFNISYNGKNYTKNINLVPIQYGKDGADAETFELHCAYSTIHYNRMLDTPALEPSSVQYKIKHTSKNGVDFITPNSNNFTISYEFIYDNDNVTSGKDESSGRTISSVTNNDGIINIPSNNLNTLTQVNIQLKHDSSVWDEDILEVVYDGVNGVDGDGTEYIYYRSKEPVEWVAYVSGDNNNDNINPSYWTPNDDNGSSDYIPASYKNILWFDHPQGVDSSYLWEYVSQRQYNGLKNTWERYTSPITWSHYGETGRDGDGVEYIYYLCDNEYVDVNKYPLFWSNDNDFNSSEYIQADSDWKDNPSGTSPQQKYEYVSVRKYKRIKNNNDILYLLFDKYLLSTLSSEYNSFLNNTDWENEQDKPDITLLDYIFNICENHRGGTSSISSDTLLDPQSDWYDNQTIGEFHLYEFIYEILSKYFNSEEHYSTYDQGTETCTYLKLIEKNDKFWTPYSEPTLWAKYGEKGDDGNPGADAITLDFTNDQINFAVTESKYPNVITSQSKTTTLNIINIGNYTASVTISDRYVNTNSSNSSAEKIKCTKTSSTDSSFTYQFSVDSSNGHQLEIPENGLEIIFTVTLTHSTLSRKTLIKVLKICGQHNGENAVTYELNPVNTAIYKDNTTFSPASIQVNLTKYNGQTVEVLSYSGNNSFASEHLISYKISGNINTHYYTGNINCSTAKNGNPIDGNITLRLHKTTDPNSSIIDSETIPLIERGEKGEPGSQGFTGPIVRMRGEFKGKSNDSYYTDGSINSNYTESNGPRYIDIVAYSYNNEGTKYYQCQNCSTYIDNDAHPGYINCGISINTGVVGCYSEYNNSIRMWPGGNSPYWKEATQFDFIATKLLYADQALINQISSHDFIATDSNGKPVAGITSSYISTSSGAGTSNDHSLLTNYGVGRQTDSNNAVRIWAGNIGTSGNYSLTNTPFNVRQDGTTYMTKARISGDAIIEGDITADTLKLQQTTSHYNGSFTYFDSQTSEFYLPNLEKNTTQMYFVLCRNGNTNTSYQIKLPYYSPTQDRFQYSENSRITVKSDRKFKPENNTLYQLVGTYVSTENYPTWSVIETPLAPISSGDTIYNPKYYDVTADVTLIGYNYSNGGWYDMSTSELSVPKIQYGSDNGNNYVSIDFYTYLSMDESLVNKNNGNNYTAYADLGKIFGWFS